MGKAIKEARSEVEKCAWVMEYYADNGKIFVNEEIINLRLGRAISITLRECRFLKEYDKEFY
jgi:succinate-semialdehyde dehydrogenase/glutarate-semialdehyde dehydrogenase/succinyl-CoA reductase